METTHGIIRFIKMPEVLAMTGLGRSTIYRMMAAGEFPPSRSYPNSPMSKFWVLQEVDAWQRAAIESGNQSEKTLELDHPRVAYEYAIEATGLSKRQINYRITTGAFPYGLTDPDKPNSMTWRMKQIDDWVTRNQSVKQRSPDTRIGKPDRGFWYIGDLERETGLKRSELRSLIRSGSFPAGELVRTAFGKRGWLPSIIRQWVDKQATIQSEPCSFVDLIG